MRIKWPPKKKLTIQSVLEGLEDTPVEIDISERCEHECFDFVCSSAAVYRLGEMEPQHLSNNTHVMIHSCGDGEDLRECLEGCWIDEEE